MTGLYLWLKAFHIIAIIAWMAGALYLPRLFVYPSLLLAGTSTKTLLIAYGAVSVNGCCG